jgi:hypothetical protein
MICCSHFCITWCSDRVNKCVRSPTATTEHCLRWQIKQTSITKNTNIHKKNSTKQLKDYQQDDMW